MEHETSKSDSVADIEATVVASASADVLHGSEIVSFNTPRLDVRAPTHKIVATQANICSKTCNSN
jgi:hypothetical protein